MQQTVQTLSTEETYALFKGKTGHLKMNEGTEPVFRFSGDGTALFDPARPKVAILGTRTPSDVDVQVTKRLVAVLSENPSRPVILSGLAVGTDTVVHTAALACGVSTYAVMPCGLDMIYPSQNIELATLIQKRGGGLLSCFPDGERPSATNFFHRAKAIALMSDVLILPCARRNGAAVVAARFATSQGNPNVFAVAGPPDSVTHGGCNQLIRENIATIICSLEEFSRFHF